MFWAQNVPKPRENQCFAFHSHLRAQVSPKVTLGSLGGPHSSRSGKESISKLPIHRSIAADMLLWVDRYLAVVIFVAAGRSPSRQDAAEDAREIFTSSLALTAWPSGCAGRARALWGSGAMREGPSSWPWSAARNAQGAQGPLAPECCG